MIYFCSDLHFNHKNILKFEPCRIDAVWELYYKHNQQLTKEEFRSFVLNLYTDESKFAQEALQYILDQHNNMLIQQWNSVVKKMDTVWVLGDICFGKDPADKFINQMNGIKHLIKGNHDKKPDDYYRDIGFTFVSSYPVLLKQHFLLMHIPPKENKVSPDFFYIYGHVHSNLNYDTYTENTACVCVERHNFKPVSIANFNNYLN